MRVRTLNAKADEVLLNITLGVLITLQNIALIMLLIIALCINVTAAENLVWGPVHYVESSLLLLLIENVKIKVKVHLGGFF